MRSPSTMTSVSRLVQHQGDPQAGALRTALTLSALDAKKSCASQLDAMPDHPYQNPKKRKRWQRHG
ncbi:hypothetical protein EDF88_5017 [Buttiauxella sp. BIGb0552]|uniref:hypothetical protein n=1 Tax=Buttiauxella sp. BIGb0552 TaxID=2485120 RepID=UPI001065F516|nr:hypothetical protein [Buttiauxella sp. BIGb0552]TDX09602.1 hypothetical protein EDF88_5017 [Buttiauxella sp. BIGb0552]